MAEDPGLRGLLESPIADAPRQWSVPDVWPILAGFLIGALIVFAGYMVASTGTETSTVATTVAETTTTTTAATGDDIAAFPPGYVELDEMTAIAPQYVVSGGGEVFVSFASAVRRGFKPVADEFAGGTWILETTDGGMIESSQTVFSTDVPGAFSVKFTGIDGSEARHVSLENQWRRDEREAATETPFSGLPYALAELIVIELGAGTSLSIDALQLDEDGGILDWSLQGVDTGGTVGATIFGGNPENPQGVWFAESEGGFFGFRPFESLDPQLAGTLHLRSAETLSSDADVTSLTISLDTTLISVLPVEETWDLTEIPIAGD